MLVPRRVISFPLNKGDEHDETNIFHGRFGKHFTGETCAEHFFWGVVNVGPYKKYHPGSPKPNVKWMDFW